MTGRRILLVEDEPGMLMTIQDRLAAAPHTVDTAINGQKAIDRFPPELGTDPFDLVILDLMLPDIDGFEVCRTIRRRGFQVPILMLTARNAVEDRVKGLQIGADDYLPKPFSMAELMARVAALLRRPPLSAPAVQPTLAAPGVFGPFRLDLVGRALWKEDASGVTEVSLGPTEFKLLAHFVAHPGVVLPREELLNTVWGYQNEVASRTVDVHVAWLRQKLGESDHPRYLLTVRGGGYKFCP
jgi:DNA-binding response OmpR family regulator